jgi:ATP-dependent helicase HrpB
VDIEALHNFEARAEFAGFTPPDDAEALRQICEGLRSFSELKKGAVDVIHILQDKIGRRRLDGLAPPRLRLKNGREVAVHYERGKPPWIESRLQDFFGMRETPRIGPSTTPVVVHLLAPNRRPVQTTSDLAGFWERLYPQVRRELMRRYPKHSWPENPFASQP